LLRRVAIVSILVLVLTAFVAPLAWGSVTSQIIQDAADGVVNGHYTVAEVRAALAAVENDPTYSQYSDVQLVLAQYLATLLAAKTSPKPTPSAVPAATPSPSTKPMELDYTGGGPLIAFVVGGGLLAAGLAVRRFSAAGG